jgi:hypothetical protein
VGRMNSKRQTDSIKVRFDHMVKAISADKFLQMKGIGNEVPFFICPYEPEEAVEMAGLQKNLYKQLNKQGIKVLRLNLYDLVIEILKEGDDWDWYLENEQTFSKAQLKEALQSIAHVARTLVPKIQEKMNQTEFDVMFINGVGEVFPYIRSHNVLNNLQKVAKEQPMLMFFPGKYTQSSESGASLDLFGRLHDDKYYRAFNIYYYES